MKKILLVILFLGLSTQSYAIDLDSLLIKSFGGQKALEKLRNLNTVQHKGTVSFNDMEGEYLQLFQQPDKYYLEINFPIFNMIQAYDGEVAWQTNLNGQVSTMKGVEKAQLMNNIYFMSGSSIFEGRLEGSKEYLGIEMIDSVNYHKVAFYPYNSDTSIVYFDMNSGLSVIRTGQEDMFLTKTQLYDYKYYDGLLYPFKSITSIEPLGLKMSTMISHIVHNPEFNESIFSMPDVNQTDFKFPDGVDSVLIPFEYTNGHIRLEAKINGVKKVKVILDSGASTNILHRTALADFNFEIVGTIPSMGIGGTEEINLVKMDSLQIGDLLLLGQVVGDMDMTAIAEAMKIGDNFGGIIGYDFLSRFPVMIDYEQQSMTVYNPENFIAPREGVEIPFYLTMQLPTITAELEGFEGDFIVDLGNSAGLIVHKKFSDDNKLEEIFTDVKNNNTVLGGVGGNVGGKNGLAGQFRIGDILIDSLRVFIPESTPGILGSHEIAGNIGNRILDNSKFLLDYRNSRMIFLKK